MCEPHLSEPGAGVIRGKITLSGNLVDVVNRRIFIGEITISGGKIENIVAVSHADPVFILPGLIDAHVHVESSMLVPSEFAQAAVIHGTVGVVSDPHEIANVLGKAGVRFMINNGQRVPFRFWFGAPSCVPATRFETAGAILDSTDVEEMLDWPEVRYLSEMMNFPGVIFHDPEVMAKINSAIKRNKVIDGHCPGLQGEELKKYFAAGISTDHECVTLAEAREKAAMGMKILIREGSAVKNFNDIIPLLNEFPELVMFCSDDKHPDDLLTGHINHLIARAIREGFNIIDTIRACTLNPIKHYGLDSGLLQAGDPADLTIVDSLETMNVRETWIKGVKVAESGRSLIKPVEVMAVNRFIASKVSAADFKLYATGKEANVIEVVDQQIITKRLIAPVTTIDSQVVSDVESDVLKIAVINRYHASRPSIGLIKGIGLKIGAMAGTIAHDSHNIIVVGTDDESMCMAVNKLIEIGGGIAVSDRTNVYGLPLPVAGLMSIESASEVAQRYKWLDSKVKEMGSPLASPLMTLSFMALLVIPELKLSDKGLFDGTKFEFVPLFLPT